MGPSPGTAIAGYQVAVVDLRNPTRSDGYNSSSLSSITTWTHAGDPADLAARAKAEVRQNHSPDVILNQGELC